MSVAHTEEISLSALQVKKLLSRALIEIDTAPEVTAVSVITGGKVRVGG